MRFQKYVRIFVLTVGFILLSQVSLDARIRDGTIYQHMHGVVSDHTDSYSIMPFYLDIKDSPDAYLGIYSMEGGDSSTEIIVKKQKGKIVVSEVREAVEMKPEIINYHNCYIRDCIIFTDEVVFVFVKKGQASHAILGLGDGGASIQYKEKWLSPTGKAYELVCEEFNNVSQAYSVAEKFSNCTEAESDVDFGIGKFVILPQYSEGYNEDNCIEFSDEGQIINRHIDSYLLKLLVPYNNK